jgi:hypothetical protein
MILLVEVSFLPQYRDYIVPEIGWLMNMEQLVERELARETEVLGENLLQCHFFHQKSHVN